MATGTIVRFSATNGYGFITPDDGGEDVFVHASLLAPEFRNDLPIGSRVEFRAVDSDRGPKAVGVNVIEVPSTANREKAAEQRSAPVDRDDDQLCDVISAGQFAQKVTEILIEVAPQVTGAQINQIRQRLLAFGRRHGWIED